MTRDGGFPPRYSRASLLEDYFRGSKNFPEISVAQERLVERFIQIFGYPQCTIWHRTLFKVLNTSKNLNCPIVSLHELFLYDTPLELTLDHAQ